MPDAVNPTTYTYALYILQNDLMHSVHSTIATSFKMQQTNPYIVRAVDSHNNIQFEINTYPFACQLLLSRYEPTHNTIASSDDSLGNAH